eukprot:UN22638
MNLKYWFQKHPHDFMNENNFIEAQKIVKSITQNSEKRGAQLQQALDNVKLPTIERTLTASGRPDPKIPVNSKREDLDIFKIPCEEIARQLCLADFEIFRKIRAMEFMDEAWLKKKNR